MPCSGSYLLNLWTELCVQSIYDQPVIVENAGVYIIAQLGDRVGLMQNFRMVGERLLPKAGVDYIKRLNKEKLWRELLSRLGRWCWEAPGGLVQFKEGDNDDLEPQILRAAGREALEEAGFTIEDAHIVGRINTNPVFFLHSQYVVHAKVALKGNACPDDLEIIGDRRFFTMQQLRELNRIGEFDSAPTMAALALCGFSL
ncbi:NUDIX domain-containing protein [Candidatus Falkowbacteria bacterium]|nr:NUDIX domain-containing protein [Candidatus Falkowbacteria bacterium]